MRQRLETAGQQLEQASRLLESTSFQRTSIAASHCQFSRRWDYPISVNGHRGQ